VEIILKIRSILIVHPSKQDEIDVKGFPHSSHLSAQRDWG
jgi:hypothetical protein